MQLITYNNPQAHLPVLHMLFACEEFPIAILINAVNQKSDLPCPLFFPTVLVVFLILP